MVIRFSLPTRRSRFSLFPRLALVFVALFAAASVVVPTAAYAADAPDADATTSLIDARAASYLDQLLGEINARRARAGSPPVTFANPSANNAVSQYLADLTPRMVAMRSCFHGNGNPVSPGWDYVATTGLGGQARGEVLACPGDNGYWTAPKIADGWWNSPSHWQSLYGDPRVNTVACGTYGPQAGGRAYQTIACVTYRV